MKFFIAVLFFAFLCVPKVTVAQDLNSYKYIIVPEKFDLFEEKNKHQLNGLTEFLFEKYGFTAIMEGEDLPVDLANNPCSALRVDLNSDSGRFSFVTKVILVLKDCHQEIVFKSNEGRSKLKSYKFAYQEALRKAFLSVEALDYSYEKPVTSMKKDEGALIANNTIATVKVAIFTHNDIEYVLQNEGKTLILKKKGDKEPVAFLNETSTGNFVFRSDKINGTAYFDDGGNLQVEYFDTNAQVMKKRVYEKK